MKPYYDYEKNYPDEDKLIYRVLKLLEDKDELFTLIANDIISDLFFNDYIEIDLDNESLEGTKLTLKGQLFLNLNQ